MAPVSAHLRPGCWLHTVSETLPRNLELGEKSWASLS